MKDRKKKRKPLGKFLLLSLQLQWQLVGWRAIVIPIIGTSATLLSIGISFIYAQIINLIVRYVGNQVDSVFPNFWYLIAIVAIMRITELLIRNFEDYFNGKSTLLAEFNLERIIAERAATIDAAYFEDPKFQDTMLRVQKLNISWTLRNTSFIISDIVTIVIATVAILSLNWVLFILAVISTIPRLASSFYTAGKYREINLAISKKRRLNWYLRDSLTEWQQLKELRSFLAVSSFMKRFKKNHDEIIEIESNAQKKFAKIEAVAGIGSVITAVATRVWLFLQIISTKGVFSIGDYTFYDSLMGRLESSSASIVRNLKSIYEELINIEDYFEFMNTEPTVPVAKKPLLLQKSADVPEIEFRNVSFSYPQTNKKILKNISFSLKPGKKMALIGVNGAGKTTLVKLLLRFYDPDEGEIFIDGINLKEINLVSWYKKLAVIQQDFNHYPLTVAQNISFNPSGKVNEKKLKQAIKDAQADFVYKLPNQENTILTRFFDESVELSGGQWQKIALARVFYRQAPILVLDEPTSAIDARAETEIFHRLWKRQTNKGAIVISHRFSTVRDADNIVVIDKGKIIEQGTHERLMANRGVYHELFSKQAKSYQ